MPVLRKAVWPRVGLPRASRFWDWLRRLIPFVPCASVSEKDRLAVWGAVCVFTGGYGSVCMCPPYVLACPSLVPVVGNRPNR